ncbi:MAG: peptidylprolyl isomerase [Caulobacterales bacterium]
MSVKDLRNDPAVSAIVNDEPIYASDVQQEAEAQNLVKKGESVTVDSPIFSRVLEELIDQKLLALEAVERKLDESSDARFQLQAARERILGNLLVQNMVDAKVTEEAVRRLYREQINDMKLGQEIRCRHILVSSETEAQKIKTQLDKGADFATLAFQRSLDGSTRLDGGDLGYVTLDSLAPSFASAAQRTPEGKVSAPFKTDAGWHVLLVEEKRAQAPPTLEQMRPELVKFMLFDQIQNALKKLRKNAKIERKNAFDGTRVIDANPDGQSFDGVPPPQSAPDQQTASGPAAAPAPVPATEDKPRIVAPRMSVGTSSGPIETDEAAPSVPLSKALPPASVGSKAKPKPKPAVSAPAASAPAAPATPAPVPSTEIEQ